MLWVPSPLISPIVHSVRNLFLQAPFSNGLLVRYLDASSFNHSRFDPRTADERFLAHVLGMKRGGASTAVTPTSRHVRAVEQEAVERLIRWLRKAHGRVESTQCSVQFVTPTPSSSNSMIKVDPLPEGSTWAGIPGHIRLTTRDEFGTPLKKVRHLACCVQYRMSTSPICMSGVGSVTNQIVFVFISFGVVRSL